MNQVPVVYRHTDRSITVSLRTVEFDLILISETSWSHEVLEAHMRHCDHAYFRHAGEVGTINAEVAVPLAWQVELSLSSRYIA